MTLTVVTPASTYDLTTLARVKRELGITDNSSDELLQDYISEQSDVFSGMCRRVFAQETVIQTFDLDINRFDWIGPNLVLDRYPVSSIASLLVDDVAMTAGLDYELDAELGIVRRVSNGHRILWSGITATVTYTGGYQLLGALPRAIESAVLTMIKGRHFAASRDPAIRSENVYNVASVSYGSSGAALGSQPADVCAAVDLYTNYRI